MSWATKVGGGVQVAAVGAEVGENAGLLAPGLCMT